MSKLYVSQNKFLDMYRKIYPKTTNDGLVNLVQFLKMLCDDESMTDIYYAAYLLATVKHECADTWKPIVERGGKYYFNKYNAGTALGHRLGNTDKGDGYLFRGRGYVQITGRANYQKLSTALKLPLNSNLVNNPELALVPEISYRIASVGMINGLFTGKKLSDYCYKPVPDFRNARRIINGLDRAELIAGYAIDFVNILVYSFVEVKE